MIGPRTVLGCSAFALRTIRSSLEVIADIEHISRIGHETLRLITGRVHDLMSPAQSTKIIGMLLCLDTRAVEDISRHETG